MKASEYNGEDNIHIDSLKKDNIIERGIVVLSEDNDEKSIRAKLVSSLKSSYKSFEPNDFDFVRLLKGKYRI